MLNIITVTGNSRWRNN